MSRIYDIKTYSPTSSDVFFFDNNVWMFLFCPMIGGYQKSKQAQYSAFFKSIRSAKSCIWINSLVLSEFCNAWLKIEFKNWKRKPENTGKEDYKKDFIPTPIYQGAIADIKNTLRQILQIAEKTSDNFNAVNVEAIYNELANCDFNDSYYLELARMNSWKIVTDDADFFKNNRLNVEIITANI